MFFQGVSPAEFAVGALQIGAGIMGARAGLALLTAPGAAMREYSQFEEAAKGTEILLRSMGETRAALRAAERAARRFGETTIFTATQSAQQLQVLARRGYDAADAIQILEASANLAAATSTDLESAVSTNAQVLKAFARDAKDASYVADILTQATNTTALGIDELSAALKFAGPPAKLMEVNLKDTVAALAALRERGMAATQAGRGLRAVFMQLSRPTVQEAFKEIGVEVVDAQGRFRGMLAILRDFDRAMQGQTGPERMAFLVENLGKIAASAFATLSSGISTVEAVGQSLDRALGISAKQATERLDTLSAKWKLLISALSEFAITSGDKASPAASMLLDTVTALVRGIARGINTVLDFSSAFDQAADSATRMADAVRDAGGAAQQQKSIWERSLEILGAVGAAFGLYQLSRLGRVAGGALGQRIGGLGTAIQNRFGVPQPAGSQMWAGNRPATAPQWPASGQSIWTSPIGAFLMFNAGRGVGVFGRLISAVSRFIPHVFLAIAAFQALRAVVNWLTRDIRREQERQRNLETQEKFRDQLDILSKKKFGVEFGKLPLHQKVAVYEDLLEDLKQKPELRAKFPGLEEAVKSQLERLRSRLKPGESPEGARLALDEFLDQIQPSRVRQRELKEQFKRAHDALLQAEKAGVDPEKIKQARALLRKREQEMLQKASKEGEEGPSFTSGLGLWRKIQMELLRKDKAEDQRDQMIKLLEEIANLLTPLSKEGVGRLTPGERSAFWQGLEESRKKEQWKVPSEPPFGPVPERPPFGAAPIMGMQTGGLVSGTKHPPDSVPALLTGGEVVLNRQQQIRLAMLARSSPAALFRAAGVPGFQGGGAVGNIPGMENLPPWDQIHLLRVQAALRALEAQMQREDALWESYRSAWRSSVTTRRSFSGAHPGLAKPDFGIGDVYWRYAEDLLEAIDHPRTSRRGRVLQNILSGRVGFTDSYPRYGATDATSPLGRGFQGSRGRIPHWMGTSQPAAPTPTVRTGAPKYRNFLLFNTYASHAEKAAFLRAYGAYQKDWVENGVGTDMMGMEEFFNRVWVRETIQWGRPALTPLTQSPEVIRRRQAAIAKRNWWYRVGTAVSQLPMKPSELAGAEAVQYGEDVNAYIDALATGYAQSVKAGRTPMGPDFTHPGAQAGARAAYWHRQKQRMHEARRARWHRQLKARQAAQRRWFWRPIFVREEDHLSPKQQYQQMVQSLAGATGGTTLPVFVTNLDGLMRVGYKQITAIKGIGGFVHLTD